MDPAPSLPTAATAPANPAAPPTADKRSALYDLTAIFLEGGIQIWVHITGKRIREADAPWLRCPLGERGRIGTGIYERIARKSSNPSSTRCRLDSRFQLSPRPQFQSGRHSSGHSSFL